MTMFSARKKIAKEKGAEPDDFEDSVAQVCEGPIGFLICKFRILCSGY